MNLPENATTSAFVAAPPRLPDIAPPVEVGSSETTIINPIADVVAPAIRLAREGVDLAAGQRGRLLALVGLWAL